jgi:hypothetical protein
MIFRKILALFRPRPRVCDAELAALAELTCEPAVADLANDPELDLAELPPKIAAAVMLIRAGQLARTGQISRDEAVATIANALVVARTHGGRDA